MSLWLIPFVILLGLLGITLLNALTFPRLRSQPAAKNAPLVSVIIPARNEAGNIGAAVRSLLAQDYPELEVLVLDDQSSDGTGQQVLAAGGGEARLRLLQGEPLPAGWLGKNWACHQAAQQAKGEVLVFTDADVRWRPGALAALLAAMERTGADLLTVWPRQIAHSWSERLVAPMMTFAVLAYLPELAVRFMPWAAFAAANGQCLAFWRAAYQQCGGHQAVRASVLDDMSLARRVKQSGLRLAQALAAGLIETRMYQGWAEVRAGFAKNILAGHGGQPLALLASALFHWLVFVLPWLWLALGWVQPALSGWPQIPAALTLLGLSIRLLSARLDGSRLADALLLPFSVLLLSLIAAQALAWRWRGGATWKGRAIVNHQ